MSKSLQKHELSHLKEGAEGDEGNTSDTAQEKKDHGDSKNYPCSICNTMFKSAKTRQRHMKAKHTFPASDNRSLPAGLQRPQGTPVITPISISQPTLQQLEASGPLQKVDANIDTEQICRLIESLGNVQKVNQVVILGQVPHNAPPLEVQQISQGTEGLTLNLNPPQIDFMGLKGPECKAGELDSLNNHCDPMEQTIILEPITPDGQLETAPFSELGSHVVAVENTELTLDQTQQTERPEGEVSPQILQQSDISVFQSDPMGHMICQNEQDLEQTVILELTPALTPTVELEQFQTMPQNVFIPSTGITAAELVQNPDQALDQMVTDVSNTNLSIPPLPVMLELPPPEKDEHESPSCLFVPVDAVKQTQCEAITHPREEVSLQMQTESKDLTYSTVDKAALLETKKNAVQEPSERKPCDQERSQQKTSNQDQSEETSSENLMLESQKDQEKVENLSETVEPSAEQEGGQSKPEAKKLSQISELPLNVMSAQELVKVRKRKPARAFYFQGYKQDLAGSLYEDFSIYSAPVKRQRTKKSHLVVKFGPQNKDKKNKKQKKPPQKHRKIQEEVLRGKTPAIHLSKKKVSSPKKEKKGKRDKKGGAVSAAMLKAPTSIQEPELQQHKEDTRKNKKRKGVAGEHVNNTSEAASPVSKKKKVRIIKRDQPNIAKVGKVKDISARKVKDKSKTSAASAVQTGKHVIEDSLLLLKGHKQPQLKVYKLDPLKASGSTLEDAPSDSQTMLGQSKDKHPTCVSVNYPTSEGKKKGGRPKKSQKVLSLLSSKKVSLQPSESLPTKPKTTRKRRPSSKVETEGVITSSHSRRALECQDCGERFSDVSSLQKHKTSVHVVESPGLTYTNGNIFEGVSSLDLYQLPQQQDKTIGLMNASTGWDTEPEMGEIALEDRERSVSFPSLIPSPSLPVPPLDVETGALEDKAGCTTESDNQSSSEQIRNPDSLHIQSEPSSKTVDPLASDIGKHGEHTLKKTEPEVQSPLEEDIKEDLLMEVDLVTVGEQSEKDNPASLENKVHQDESVGSCSSQVGRVDKLSEQVTEDRAEKSFTSQTVSCSTHQEEVKEEEEEVVVQKKKGGKGNVLKGAAKTRGRGTGRFKRDISKKISAEATITGSGSGKEQDECQVVYENHLITSDSEIIEDGTSTEITKAKSATMSVRSEESPEKLVEFEANSSTTGVEMVMNERECDRDKSPVVILERVVTSTARAGADMEPYVKLTMNNKKQGLDSAAEKEVRILGSQEIKVEEVVSDPSQAAPACQNRPSANMQPQHHCDVRTVLVKEECSLVLNEAQTAQRSSIRWNVEPTHGSGSSSCEVIDSGETTRDCHMTPEFNSSQCIFYPVKEEEREVLVGAAPTSSENLPIGSSSNVQRPEHETKDSNLNRGSPSPSDYQEKSLRRLSSDTGDGNFTDGHETDSEWQHPPDVRDFLLQSSDEEDVGGFELSDPQLDSEAEVMAYFHKNHTNDSQQPDESSESSPPSQSQSQAPTEEGRTRKPIDYFSTYFGWDTWVEIASCTNKLSNISNPVTAREVAQFVGIHIAMGTLKFPSPRLYWEDLTKVPLIADAMPLSRFLELSRMLKLAHPAKNPADIGAQKGRQDVDLQPRHKPSSWQGETSPPGGEQRGGHSPNDLNNAETQIDPLWKAQPLLCRFKAGCQSLRRDSNYAVDQYLLPLTGKTHSKKLSLHCTKLIGFGGLLLHVDFKMGLSGKEDAVEHMVPRGSMVFLCKQELSTPAMLERLLAAGLHGAGRVGGARGQIGDEFVSSDGKLMLRRSHCGFILSTAGSGQKNMASLADNFEKAQMSAHLNRNLVNLYSIPLTASAPTCWPQAVLWYLTDLALVNSWLLYRQDHRAASTSLSFMAFRLEVSKTFIQSRSSDTQDSVPSHSPLETAHVAHDAPNPSLVEESPLPDAATRYDGSGHWPEQLAEGEGGRCRFGDCQRLTRVLCLKCCVFLCISRNHNCFLNFHNQGGLRKK